MKKYFYQKNGESFGPFTIKEFLEKELAPDTYVWYDGLKSWIPYNKSGLWRNVQHQNYVQRVSLRFILVSLVVLVSIAVIVVSGISNTEVKERDMDIVLSAYDDPEVDFQMYLNKFYRDLDFNGIRCVMPNQTIIKFANLDKLKGTVYCNGVSYGFNDDSKIEIYINPTFWKSATKAQRYWLMYHELCHDLLNIEHTPEIEQNVGELMYPYMDCGRITHMDDFIEAYQETFSDFIK